MSSLTFEWQNFEFSLSTAQDFFDISRQIDVNYGDQATNVVPGTFRIIDDQLCRIVEDIPPALLIRK